MRKRSSLAIFCILFFVPLGFAQLQIVPDTLGDPHFTSGPCPRIIPPDGALCPKGKSKCPAFYNPALLPAGYNSVSYCANVPVGIGGQSPGYTLLTMPLTKQEQQAFLLAAQKVESYVKDNATVTMEVYKVAFLDNQGHNSPLIGNEYWNPVCAADASLPPFSNQLPTIMQNPDGSYGYQNFPETYTTVLNALQAKNAGNQYPMQLINYLPSQSQINVEWPSSFLGWLQNTDLATFQLSNFLVGPSGYFPTGSKPFTLCSSPAAMKMLGFGPSFAVNGHTIDDINSPPYNMNVTLYGTDGALVIGDLTAIPPTGTNAWMYNSTSPAVVSTQLPKAFFQNTVNLALPKLSCSDPKNCVFPQGADGGRDLIGVFNHEINHVLGVMQSQYYKVSGEETSLAYTYGSALFLLDLFDLDSDFVVSGFGNPGIQSYSDFTAAPRNHDPNEPNTIHRGYPASSFTPFVQFGNRDHVMVYDVINGVPQYFPFMNNTVGNPDGDIQFQDGILYADQVGHVLRYLFVDPNLVNLPDNNVPHNNVQANSAFGMIDVDTVREYSELSANGWDVDYSTLTDPYSTVSPLLKWYQTCFDANGVFTTAKNAACKFSVTPSALKGIQ